MKGITLLILAIFLANTGFNSLLIKFTDHTRENEKIIRVAIYDSIFRSPKFIKQSLEYEWEANGVVYRFNATFISDKNILGIEKPALNNFDVFIIGASARQFIIGNSYIWKENIREFVKNGGGYVGMCGGANSAAISMNEIHDIRDIVTQSGFLEIANVYVNCQHSQEWQYAWKEAMGELGNNAGMPLNLSINTSHPIFYGYNESMRNLRWWGGPSLTPANLYDENFGKISPLAVYMEEPCKKAPIHFWIWKGKWIPYKNITTDLMNQYAAITTTYGKGRIVLFGPHPEYSTWYDGHVVECKTKYVGWEGNKFVYYWQGNETSLDYNWWIIRRSVAWAAGLSIEEMPPIE